MARKNHHEQQSTFSKKEKLIAALAAPFAVVALAACNSGDRVEIRVDRPGVSQDANPDTSNVSHESRSDLTLENSTPEEFFDNANYTREERVNWAYEKLNQPRNDGEFQGMSLLESSHAELKKRLNLPGRYEYIKDLVTPSENMTGDQIETLSSSISYLLVTSDLPEDTRVKMTAALVDSSSDTHDEIVEFVRNRDVDALGGATAVNISSSDRLPKESPVFRHYVLSNGYDPAGIPSKIAEIMGTTDPSAPNFQVIYQFIDGKPVLVQNYDIDEMPSMRVDNLRDIPHEPV